MQLAGLTLGHCEAAGTGPTVKGNVDIGKESSKCDVPPSDTLA